LSDPPVYEPLHLVTATHGNSPTFPNVVFERTQEAGHCL